jgi:hypothetical protein
MDGKASHYCLELKNQRGATLVFVAILLGVIVALTALAVDVGHLYGVRNELQNAADAGALAGAYMLYDNSTMLVDVGANQAAKDMATANKSGGAPVTVNWTSGNTGDVQRGHYCFSTGTFTPNDNLHMVSLWNVSAAELDANATFINAVRVIARRPAAPSFFARIFGYDNFAVSAAAVAYIGFAGTLEPGTLDQPIAICQEGIRVANEYTCGVGRMLSSGATSGHQTGGWTNFSQEPCNTASATSVKPLVCATGNVNAVNLGDGMGTTGGEVQVAFNDLVHCWKNAPGLDTDHDGWPDKPWKLTLPVIECSGNNVGNCSTVVGAVELNVVWITQTDKNQMKEVPMKMGDWTCPSGYTPGQCWTSFVQHFNLKDVLNNSDAFYEDKTIYFLPDCTPHIPMGTTGGENFGILAKIPVLVK